MADLDTVALVMAGLTGKAWRGAHGGDRAIASLLVERMCAATKCRSADDLAYYVCEQHPSLARARASLAQLPAAQLLDRAASMAALPERAVHSTPGWSRLSSRHYVPCDRSLNFAHRQDHP